MTLDDLRNATEPGRGNHRQFTGERAAMAPTLEACEFLYALVRLTRPARVLELGTGLGVSACFIATALQENGTGWLTTLEPNHFYAAQARELFTHLPCDVIEMDSAIPKTTPDLVFIDSDYTRREADIARWLMPPVGPLVVIHDANRAYAEIDAGVGVLLPCVDGLWVGVAG